MATSSFPRPVAVPSVKQSTLERRTRQPIVWNRDDFNLTELIDTVEKNIEKLEQMERRPKPKRDLLEMPLTEEILNLPGFKPRGGSLRLPRTKANPFQSGDPCTLTRKGPMSRPLPQLPEKPNVSSAETPPALPPKQKKQPEKQVTNSPALPMPAPPASYYLGKDPLPKLDASLIQLHERLQPKHSCVTNVIYSRRLPSPPIFRRTSTPLTEDFKRMRAKDDSMASELASQLIRTQIAQSQRKLYCPLCIQTFGYSFGLECHLLSVHFAELTDLQSKDLGMSKAQSCPCCRAHFLKPGIIIKHLVLHHPDFVTDTLLAGERGIDAGDSLEEEDAKVNQVLCRFCGQQFLRRHQKLLMLHIEQKHASALQSILNEHQLMDQQDSLQTRHGQLICPEIDLIHSSPTLQGALKERLKKSEHGAGNNARRELRFESPDAKKHHYYEIIDLSAESEEKENVMLIGTNTGGTKRDRNSEEESSLKEADAAYSASANSKIKQVKKRVKRIDTTNTEKRRSLEVQELLRIPHGHFHVRTTSETATFVRAPSKGSSTLSKSHSMNNPARRPSNRRRLPSPPRDECDEPTYQRIPQPEPPRPRLFSRQTSSESTRPPTAPPATSAIGAAAGPRTSTETESDADSEMSYGRWTFARKHSIRGSKSKKKQPQQQQQPPHTKLQDNNNKGDPSPHSTEQKLFRCNLCDTAFLENAFLLVHIKNQHRNNVARALKPQYSCGICPAKFFKNSFLVRHAESHQFELVSYYGKDR